MSAVCRPYISRISAVYPPYVSRLSAVCQPYISRMSAVYLPYVSRLSAVCQPCLISQYAWLGIFKIFSRVPGGTTSKSTSIGLEKMCYSIRKFDTHIAHLKHPYILVSERKFQGAQTFIHHNIQVFTNCVGYHSDL